MLLNYSESTNEKLKWLDITKKILIITGSACFIISLFQVSLFTSGEDIKGFWLFFLGWIGLVIFQFSWFANPLNLLALLLLKQHPVVALLLSALAFAMASQTLFFTEIPLGLHQNKVFIKELGLGFYFWYLAQALFLMIIILQGITKVINKP